MGGCVIPMVTYDQRQRCDTFLVQLLCTSAIISDVVYECRKHRSDVYYRFPGAEPSLSEADATALTELHHPHTP